MIGLIVNDKPLSFPQQTTLWEVLSSLEVANTQGIAIAVNDIVIPKKQWETKMLEDKDRILIVTAVQGG